MSIVRYHQHRTQKVPSDPNWRVNCSAYCMAMLVIDETVGGLVITGEQVRAWSDEPNPDKGSPGLNIHQLQAVARKLHVYLDDKTEQTFAQLRAHVRAGARAGLQIDYASLGDCRCQSQGDFGHMIVIVDFSADGKTLTASDPLCSKTLSYPAAVVSKAATAFARETGISEGIRFCTTKRIPLVVA